MQLESKVRIAFKRKQNWKIGMQSETQLELKVEIANLYASKTGKLALKIAIENDLKIGNIITAYNSSHAR